MFIVQATDQWKTEFGVDVIRSKLKAGRSGTHLEEFVFRQGAAPTKRHLS
jgi:hypothetical protein